MGRPTEYSEEILEKAEAYIQECQDEWDEFHKTRGDKSDSYERVLNVKLPTIEGLAVRLKLSRETIYDWETKYPDFSDILEELRAIQAERLLNMGLSGDYNPLIAKLVLSKHGYIEKKDIDHTSKGKQIGGFNFIRNDGNKDGDNNSNN